MRVLLMNVLALRLNVQTAAQQARNRRAAAAYGAAKAIVLAVSRATVQEPIAAVV